MHAHFVVVVDFFSNPSYYVWRISGNEYIEIHTKPNAFEKLDEYAEQVELKQSDDV